jgi:lipopolysaccharide export system protein LptC
MSSPTAEHVYRANPFGADMQRRLHELERWRRHSRRIKLLRRLLPSAVVALLAIMLGWAAYSTLIAPLTVGPHGAGTAIRMINPRFFGRDQGGRPFFVSATSAVRDNNQFQQIYVENPVLVLGAAPAPQTRVTADKGVYREDTKILTLDGNVHVHDTQGNDFLTAHADVNTVTDDVQGPSPVTGHGPLGRIAALSYAVRSGGAQVFFNGKVVARIEQSHAPTPAPAPAPDLALRGPR